MKTWKCEFKFEPRDIWIGLFWDLKNEPFDTLEKSCWHLYVCILPMLLIHVFQAAQPEEKV